MNTALKLGVCALLSISLAGCSEVILDSNQLETTSAGVLNFAQADVSRASTLSEAVTSAADPVPVRIDPVSKMSGPAIVVQGQVTLDTAEHSQNERYDIVWSGVRTSAHAQPTQITLIDAAGARALRIDFERQGLSVVTGTITGLPPIPYSRTQPHQIEIDLRPGEAAGVDIKITQSGEVLFERTGLEILDPEFEQLDQLKFDSPIEASPYYAQDILVEAHS
jgi:hypothetical protein